MLNANDLAAHPGGPDAAIEAVRASGLRVTGFQVLRDFEGLSGHLHAYKVDIAKAMLSMCRALGARVLQNGLERPKARLLQVLLGEPTGELVARRAVQLLVALEEGAEDEPVLRDAADQVLGREGEFR